MIKTFTLLLFGQERILRLYLPEEIRTLIKESDLTGLEKIFLDCGTKEAVNNDVLSQQFLQSNLKIYEILKEKNNQTILHILDGTIHHYTTFKKRVPEFLPYLLGVDQIE